MKTQVPASSKSPLYAMGVVLINALAPTPAPASPDSSPEIVALRIIKHQDTARFVKTPAGWVVARDSFPVNPAPIEAAIRDLGSLKAKSRPYPVKKTAKHPPGHSQVTWTDSSGLSSNVILLETLTAARFENERSRWRYDTSSDGHIEHWIEGEDSTLWKSPGSPKTWLAEGAFGWASPRLIDWMSRSLLPDFFSENIQALTVDWRDSLGRPVHYRLVRDRNAGVRMTEPRIVPLANRNAALVFDRANQFAVDEFLPAGTDSMAWGLAKPSMQITMTLWDGATYTLSAGNAWNGYRYVQHPRHPRPVLVLDARFAPLRKTPDQVLAPLRENADEKD